MVVHELQTIVEVSQSPFPLRGKVRKGVKIPFTLYIKINPIYAKSKSKVIHDWQI